MRHTSLAFAQAGRALQRLDSPFKLRRTMRNQLLRNANSLKTNCFGNRSAGLIRSTLASSMNSKSPTHRTLPSIAATMPREISQPAIWHLAANALCDQPRCARNCRTCGPTMFFRVGIVRIFRLDPTNQFLLNCLGLQTSCFVSGKLLLTQGNNIYENHRERQNQRLDNPHNSSLCARAPGVGCNPNPHQW